MSIFFILQYLQTADSVKSFSYTFIKHCNNCSPRDFPALEDAGIEPRTGATAVRLIG